MVHETGEPPSSVQTYFDAYRNECDRLKISAGSSTLRYDTTFEVPDNDDAVDLTANQAAIVDLPDEAFLRWRSSDPRNIEPRIGRAVIAWGRDVHNAAMVTTWGAPTFLSVNVWADEVLHAI
jgi:hypothetical protein